MRKTFAALLADRMVFDDRIVVLTADLGYRMWDSLRERYPERFFNVGAAEQLMIGMAAGLAYRGKIPVCYSITQFLLSRPFEWLRNYVNAEKLPIKLVGAGRDREYAHDGLSHWSEDASRILALFPNIDVFVPVDLEELHLGFGNVLASPGPSFISLSKRIFKGET